jgi:hypothetical protein
VADNLRDRTLASMTRNGIGFSLDLMPLFSTSRSELRIHPDGGYPGTMGCIGLLGNKTNLSEFQNMISIYLHRFGPINLQVTY